MPDPASPTFPTDELGASLRDYIAMSRAEMADARATLEPGEDLTPEQLLLHLAAKAEQGSDSQARGFERILLACGVGSPDKDSVSQALIVAGIGQVIMGLGIMADEEAALFGL